MTAEPDPRGDLLPIAREIDRAVRARPNAGVPELRAMRRAFSARLRRAPARAVVALAARLARGASTAHRLVAAELVRHHPGALEGLDFRDVERLGRGIASWADVDCFAVSLAGPAWRRGGVPDAAIHRWACSRDRWWRRAALVSTVPLNSRAQGGQGDARRTLAVCRLLEDDRDPMVVKAMSWALRELAKRDPGAARRYLASRAGALAALVRREVRNKLETGRKNPRG